MAMQALEKEESSEAAALAAIVEWSLECPPWQRDALRRLCAKDRLDESDVDALVAICKKSPDALAEPVTADHVRDPGALSAAVVLKGIHDIRHVNALAEGEKLTFCKNGLTIVYGDNGSGKSGYARILKKACRARAQRDETILPNVYATEHGKPTAIIDFSVNEQNNSSTWILDKPANRVLSAVSVFDSRTASVHVEESNDLAYIPLPLKILESLAQTCKVLKQRLDNELEEIVRQTPDIIKNPLCQPGTAVGKLMNNLSAETLPEDVVNLATLSDTDRTRLATLQADLTADPAHTVRKLRINKKKLNDGIIRVEALIAAVSDDTIVALNVSFRAFEVAQEAAKAASVNLFSGEALPDIGGNAWRVLWEAARTYSETSAYFRRAFPATEDGAVCVLCLQRLSPAAVERFHRFEAFIKDECKRKEADAQTTYKKALDAFVLARISKADASTLFALVGDDLENPTTAAELRRSVVLTSWRLHRALRRHRQDASIPPIVALPNELRILNTALQKRIDALAADAASEERKALVSERDNLLDRTWFAGIQGDLLAEIDRKKKLDALQKLLQEARTHRITAKSKEITSELVTNALRSRFAKEINQLGVAELAIELGQASNAQGVPRFRIRLINKPDENVVGAVLSEGEHRCVALAAFLAEVETNRSAIVFDDPVSSLDHGHREEVSKRLATEGFKRQVIVFTHDLAFLFLLDAACQEKGVPIALRSVNRGTEFAGYCQPNPPSKALPIQQAIDSMKAHLENTKVQYEKGMQADWSRTVGTLEVDLRNAWERAVEEILSPVLKRFSNKVETKGLQSLTVLTAEDCKRMRDAYGRCSMLLHSEAGALNTSLPKPDRVRAEIAALQNWVLDLRQRQQNAHRTTLA
jgi:AAA domain